MNERPKIQIDDEIREMTDEEYAEWLARDIPQLLVGEQK